jgi:uncharacterized membrane protein
MSASRWRDERGLALPIVALMIGTLVLMASFAVDLGRQRTDRRLAQAGADVIALDMMRVVNGRTLQAVVADSGTVTALNASAARNDFVNNVPPAAASDTHLPRITALQWGVITPGNDGDTFEPLYNMVGGDGDGDGNDDRFQVPNAVRITTERTTDFFFQPGDKGVIRTAIAALPLPDVDVTVGSVAAGFKPGYPVAAATLSVTVQVLNRRLHRQFNATSPTPSTAFDLVGYQGLAAADVDLWRVAANAGFASPNDMAHSSMTTGQFFNATASALDQQAAEGDPNAANAATQLRRFQTQMGADSTGTMQVGNVASFAQGGDDAAADGKINVLDWLSGTAQVINNQNFASFTFNPGIPGVASASVQQYTVSKATTEENKALGESVHNDQVRFAVNLTVAPLTGMTSPVNIPLVIQAANADALVSSLNCADPVTGSVAGLHVTTSGASVTLGTTSDLAASTVVTTPGVLVQGGLGLLNSSVFLALGLTPLQVASLNLTGSLTATGAATVLGGTSDHTFLSNAPPVAFQRAPGGLGAATLGSQLSASLSASQGSSVLNSTATTALRNQLAYVFNNVQALVIDPLLQQAGVNIAGADVKAEDMNCDGAGLKLVG